MDELKRHNGPNARTHSSDQLSFVSSDLPKLKTSDPTLTEFVARDGRIPNEYFMQFASAMANNTMVVLLDLSNGKYDVANSRHLMDILKKNRKLRKLLLNNNKFANDGVKQIAPAVGSNTVLEELYLAGNAIGDEGAIALFAALARNVSPLLYLDLSHNKLTPAAFESVGKSLSLNEKLCVLILDKNHIDDKGLADLAVLFSKNNTLTVISLCETQIGTEGFVAFAQAMSGNKSIQKLLLRNNRLRSCGKSLQQILQCPSLIELDISDNPLGEESIIGIAEGIKTNQRLEVLNLTNTKATTSTMRRLTEALSKNHTLVKLLLGNNGLQDDSLEPLVGSLSKSDNVLQEIDLSGNLITPKLAIEIATALRDNQSLCRLDMQKNPYDQSILAPIIEMFKHNFVLQELNLGDGFAELASSIAEELNYNKALGFFNYNICYRLLVSHFNDYIATPKLNKFATLQLEITNYFTHALTILNFIASSAGQKNPRKAAACKKIIEGHLLALFGKLRVIYSKIAILPESAASSFVQEFETFYAELAGKLPGSVSLTIENLPKSLPALPVPKLSLPVESAITSPRDKFEEVKLARPYCTFFNRVTKNTPENIIPDMAKVFVTNFIADITVFNQSDAQTDADKDKRMNIFEQYKGLFCLTLVTQLVNAENPVDEIKKVVNHANTLKLEAEHITTCLQLINFLKASRLSELSADCQTFLREAFSNQVIRFVELEESTLPDNDSATSLRQLQDSLRREFIRHSSHCGVSRTPRSARGNGK